MFLSHFRCPPGLPQPQNGLRGLVKPDDPDAKVKFLAAEALRGVGGIVLDANGHRFCNELGRRDYVTGAPRPTGV